MDIKRYFRIGEKLNKDLGLQVVSLPMNCNATNKLMVLSKKKGWLYENIKERTERERTKIL